MSFHPTKAIIKSFKTKYCFNVKADKGYKIVSLDRKYKYEKVVDLINSKIIKESVT